METRRTVLSLFPDYFRIPLLEMLRVYSQMYLLTKLSTGNTSLLLFPVNTLANLANALASLASALASLANAACEYENYSFTLGFYFWKDCQFYAFLGLPTN